MILSVGVCKIVKTEIGLHNVHNVHNVQMWLKTLSTDLKYVRAALTFSLGKPDEFLCESNKPILLSWNRMYSHHIFT